ncbi:uncharacterized protein TRIVIDRAFT_202469 [Trichoderma virens Gv29-8]|uniref:SnoaL-like domain-containing protein n=1 Tax=Hypocrea virens (strain Gv29-8 / FGSC 10586) TaxID=413071 RepID=G9MXF1_HYPVG|nr:uncharacterized protein TRIVIDRAFT_202469 [Trichoderma virens Gv29-8]EHK20849.1 hypothetical protein TRIVIDRAFT_202469 [Trichoderma virens Gv29-8]UKZ56884.1 hypothetical protein TrVGV298_010729 [Trichoderma virens]
MALDNTSFDLTSHLKQLYAAYRHTKDISLKGNFFSPTCSQVCRPKPSFAARNRETIVGYLHASADKGTSLSSSSTEVGDKPSKKGYYTIRPLREDEFEFGTDEHVAPAGFATVGELKQKAKAEGWVGMRVDLWDEEEGKEGFEGTLLVKVQYWWRKEEDGWIQILHDIMYLGPRDGTEGSEGEVLE